MHGLLHLCGYDHRGRRGRGHGKARGRDPRSLVEALSARRSRKRRTSWTRTGESALLRRGTCGTKKEGSSAIGRRRNRMRGFRSAARSHARETACLRGAHAAQYEDTPGRCRSGRDPGRSAAHRCRIVDRDRFVYRCGVRGECFNTALESVATWCRPGTTSWRGARRTAAAAVLVFALAAVAVAALVFVPRLAALLGA